MPLYVLGSEKIEKLPTTTFAEAKIQERSDLQRLLREQIEILVPGGLVLAEEFCQWDDSSRRIDLLVLDKAANLVVVELSGPRTVATWSCRPFATLRWFRR